MELGFEVSIFFSMHCFSTAEKPALSAVLAHLSQEFRRLRYRPDYACHAFPRQSHTGGRTRTRRLRHREPRRQHPENSPKCSICDDSQRFTARSFGPLHHFKRRFNSAILRSSRRSRAAGRYQRIRVGGCAKQSRRQLSETCGVSCFTFDTPAQKTLPSASKPPPRQENALSIHPSVQSRAFALFHRGRSKRQACADACFRALLSWCLSITTFGYSQFRKRRLGQL